MASLKMYSGRPKDLLVRYAGVTRSMVAGTAIMKLPKGARVIALILNGTASNAGTTATLSIGTTTTATEWVNAADVKTAATGSGTVVLNGVAGALGGGTFQSSAGPTATSDIIVYAKYAETGGASSAGGWQLAVVHTVGETTR